MSEAKRITTFTATRSNTSTLPSSLVELARMAREEHATTICETEVDRTRVIDQADSGAAPAPEEQPGEPVTALPQKSNKRYKFIRSIGFGGMKAVLLVRDADTGRDVAMAMMPDFRDRPASDVLRFTHEARVCAMLEHPNIVPVHDMGTDLSGAPFFTMKFLRGQSLATWLRRVRRDEPEAVAEFTLERSMQIFTRVCNAIDFAHSQGILHLDIKPDNVNIGDFGEVLVLDWGLAMSVSGEELDPDSPGGILSRQQSGVRNGVAKGTPGFMAPEQAAGWNDRLDRRTDIYALGALLYSMLVLHSPLAGLPVEEIMDATLQGTIPPPTECALPRWPVPDALNAICRKAMAPRPEDRYQTVAEMREDIQSFRHGYAPVAQNASPLLKTGLFVLRNFLETLMVLVILVLAAALAYVLFLRV